MILPVLSFVCFVALASVVTVFHYVGWRAGLATVIVLPLWLAYVGVLSYLGIVADAERSPPGIAFILIPTILFIALALVRGRFGARIVASVPLALLIGAQVFRIGVELILHRAWQDGLAPRMLTYAGANFDILIAVSAPLVAWAVLRRRLTPRWAIAWNIAGLLMLTNVIARSAMTAPGPFLALQTDVPNLVIGTFPYTFIPGFFAPLAIALHFLAIRGLRQQPRSPRRLNDERDDLQRFADAR
jgi:hypothetical protein